MKTDKQIESNQTIIKDDTLVDQKKPRKEKYIGRIKSIASNTSGFFGSIIIILVVVSLIRILRGNSDDIVSFGSLLDLLQDAPVISDGVGTFVERLNITADWGVFNFLRNLFNDILGFWSILIWMGSSLVDVIVYIYYFLKWMFI